MESCNRIDCVACTGQVERSPLRIIEVFAGPERALRRDGRVAGVEFPFAVQHGDGIAKPDQPVRRWVG